jgi:hypothetical protein
VLEHAIQTSIHGDMRDVRFEGPGRARHYSGHTDQRVDQRRIDVEIPSYSATFRFLCAWSARATARSEGPQCVASIEDNGGCRNDAVQSPGRRRKA